MTFVLDPQVFELLLSGIEINSTKTCNAPHNKNVTVTAKANTFTLRENKIALNIQFVKFLDILSGIYRSGLCRELPLCRTKCINTN